MKKTLLLLSIICLSAISINVMSAPITLVKAKNFLENTNKIIFKAKDEINVHKVYNGVFSKAVIYQREAKKMFSQKKYRKAVELSFLARFYAHQTINTNTRATKLFISTLSDAEQKIVIDDTSAGFWQPSKTGKEFTNDAFVKNAKRNHPVYDYVNVNLNKDKEFANATLNLQLQY